MGIIICQDCGREIEAFETEKVSTLYGKCKECHDHHKVIKDCK